MAEASAERPTIVLAVDGLRAAALGAYGQTAYETPTFDALTAEAITHDWCCALTPEPSDLYQVLVPRLPGVTLLTEDANVTAPLSERSVATHEIESPTPASVAEAIESTTLATVWAQIAERTIDWAEGDASPLLWIHTRGLYGPWDAPEALYETLRDEDDPACEAGVTPPDLIATGDELHEAAFDASCRYAGQVMTLDACLAGWLDLIEGLFEGVDYRLVLAGLRGFPLGEHGRVGGVDDRLFSEQQQTPLLVRDGDSESRFTRNPSPVSLAAALQALLAGGPASSSPVVLRSSRARAIRTEERFLRQPLEDQGDAELYVKPDDRWEQNDIASLEEQTVEHLTGLLASGAGPSDSGVAAESRQG